MDRFNFYFEQLVGEADMDEVFDFAENADHALMSDNGYTGVVAGLGVTENLVPDLNVIVATGTAYDQTGERIRIGASLPLDMSTDSNAVSTTVAVNGNEKWLSIFVEFARVLSDPRVDGNGVTIQYRETESFTLIKEQGAEAAPGTAASLLAVNSEPYAPGAGGTLTLQVNGSAVQTVTLAATDTTAALVALAINTQTTGINATDSAGAVLLETFTANAIAKLQVTGGTAAAAFAFPGGIASGAGGPTPPALKGDALLLADVLVRRDGGGVTTTQIFNAPDVGGAAGYIDEARRQVTFIFNGTTFEIREGTITGFATQLAQDLQNHISNTGNAHPSTAITFDGTGSTGPDLPPLGATATVDSALDELDLRKASLPNDNTFTGGTNTFTGTNFVVSATASASVSGLAAAISSTGGDVDVTSADAITLTAAAQPITLTATGAGANGIVLNAPASSNAVRMGFGSNRNIRLEATTNINSVITSEAALLEWESSNHPFSYGTGYPVRLHRSNGEAFPIGSKGATDRLAVLYASPAALLTREVVQIEVSILYWKEGTASTNSAKITFAAAWDGGGAGGSWNIVANSYGANEWLSGGVPSETVLSGNGIIADVNGVPPTVSATLFAIELHQAWASDLEDINVLTSWTTIACDDAQ